MYDLKDRFKIMFSTAESVSLSEPYNLPSKILSVTLQLYVHCIDLYISLDQLFNQDKKFTTVGTHRCRCRIFIGRGGAHLIQNNIIETFSNCDEEDTMSSQSRRCSLLDLIKLT